MKRALLLAAVAATAAGSADAQYLTPAMEQAGLNLARVQAGEVPQPAFPFTPPPMPADLRPRFAEQRPQAQQQYPAAVPPQQQQYAAPTAQPQFADLHLPSAHELVRQATMVETDAEAEAESPATRTVPLGKAKAEGDEEDGDDVADDTGNDELEAKKGGAAAGSAAPRFAEDDSGDSEDSEDAEDSAEDSADGGSEDSEESSDEESSDAASTTTIVAPSEAKKCKGFNKDGTCTVRWSRGDMKFTTKTVPRGSLKDDDAKAGGSTKIVTSSSSSSESSDGLGDGDFVLSKDPDVAKLQTKYRAQHKELKEEVAWVRKVRGVIRTYQQKVFNVESHIASGKANLYKLRDSINKTIRDKKTNKLRAEMRAAVEALNKLQAHEQSLSSRVSDISKSKGALRSTISKIRLALGKAAGEDFTTMARFQEVLKQSPPEKEVERANSLLEASSAIKDHMAELQKAMNHPGLTEEEKAATRSLPAPSLIERREEAHGAAPAATEHKVYRVPRLPTPDTSIVDQNIDPSIKDEYLSQQFDQVMADTAANSYLG